MNKLLTIPRNIIWTNIKKKISDKNGTVLFYGDEERSKIINLIKKIKKEVDMELSDNEAYQIYNAVNITKKINGDIVEVGVYKGGSAKLISAIKCDKNLHLFDTFDGLPSPCSNDDNNHFKAGQFKTKLEDVKETLKEHNNIKFYKGLFPETGKEIENKKFSFVHLDVDLYKSTLDCLEFFYPRMNKGAILISHDYVSSPGVKKAFDEFFKDKPEPIIQVADSQCLIVKTCEHKNLI